MYDADDKIVEAASFRTMPERQWRGSEEGDQKAKENLVSANRDSRPVVENDREENAAKQAESQLASGNNHEIVDVKEGDQFIRMTSKDDRGTSAYFTKESEIKDISYRDNKGQLHIDEDAYRNRFAIPSESKLERCETYTAKKDFKTQKSEVAGSTEHFGRTNHGGGGTQYIIPDRKDKLGEHPDSVCDVKCHDSERFQDAKTAMRESAAHRQNHVQDKAQTKEQKMEKSI